MLLKLADVVVYGILGLDPATRLGGAAHFFVYDAAKILILLFFLIFVVGVLRTYLPQKKIRRWMDREGIGGGIFLPRSSVR
ncbi:MAG: hypothetical protein ACE14U_07420 [Candidatus Velamenicoccus archaeovorus]